MLNVDWSGIKNRSAWARNDGQPTPLAGAVAILSPVLAMGDLTEKNLDEWARRAAVLQAMDGPWLKHSDGSVYLVRKHLEPFVGMKTNVTPEKASSWNARMMKNAWRKVQEKAERIQQDPEKEVARR